MTTDLETIAAEQVACPACGAAPGKPCQTRRGDMASSTHIPRISPLWDAFALGYNEGYESGVSRD